MLIVFRALPLPQMLTIAISIDIRGAAIYFCVAVTNFKHRAWGSAGWRVAGAEGCVIRSNGSAARREIADWRCDHGHGGKASHHKKLRLSRNERKITQENNGDQIIRAEDEFGKSKDRAKSHHHHADAYNIRGIDAQCRDELHSQFYVKPHIFALVASSKESCESEIAIYRYDAYPPERKARASLESRAQTIRINLKEECERKEQSTRRLDDGKEWRKVASCIKR